MAQEVQLVKAERPPFADKRKIILLKLYPSLQHQQSIPLRSRDPVVPKVRRALLTDLMGEPAC